MDNYVYFSFPHTPQNWATLRQIFETQDVKKLLDEQRIYPSYFKDSNDIKNELGKVLVSANPNVQVFIIIEKEHYSDTWKTLFSNYVEYENLEKALDFLTVQRLQ